MFRPRAGVSNTDFEVSLSPDSAKEYKLPANTLRADFSPNRYPSS